MKRQKIILKLKSALDEILPSIFATATLCIIVYVLIEGLESMFLPFISLVGVLFHTEEIIKSHRYFLETIEKSEDVDKFLDEKIESMFSGRGSVIRWLLVLLLLSISLLAALMPVSEIIAMPGREILLFLFFLLFFWIISLKTLKEFVKSRIKFFRIESQLLMYSIFSPYMIMLLFLSIASLGWIVYFVVQRTSFSISLAFYLGYGIAIVSIIFIFVRFVSSIVADILRKVKEKKTCNLKKEKENMCKKIKEITQGIFTKDIKELEMNYLRKEMLESRLKIISEEIQKVEEKYQQKQSGVIAIIAFLAIVSPLIKVIIDFIPP